MFIIQGPYPTLTNTVVLPSPDLQDTETVPMSIVWKQAMDGTNYTYGASNRTIERIYNFSFSNIAYEKMQELVEFYTLCATSETRIRFDDPADPNNPLLVRARFMNPTLNKTIDKRSKGCGTEAGSFSLSFRGYTL